MVVQYVINGYGFLFVAGFTATNKLYGLLEMAAISYGYAIVTYVGQNLGAKQFDRIKSGVRVSLLISLATSIVISVAMFLFGKPILSLFLSGEQHQIEAVLEIAFHYLSIMAAMLWVLYFLYVVSFGTSGTWRYFASNVKWICGVLDANWSGFNSSDFYRSKWNLFCRDCCLEWSGFVTLH